MVSSQLSRYVRRTHVQTFLEVGKLVARGPRLMVTAQHSALKIGRNCMFGQGENGQGFDVRYGLFWGTEQGNMSKLYVWLYGYIWYMCVTPK